MPSNLFGVDLPITSKQNLINEVQKLDSSKKAVLYFLYSEFLLRANRNPWYRDVLKNADFTAVDGKGLWWVQSRTSKMQFIPRCYIQYFLKLPFLLRLFFFVVLFILELFFSFFSGLTTLLLKTDFSKISGNKLILGRDFVYNLFEIAQSKKWHTVIVGGNETNQNIIRSKIIKKYPELSLKIWSRNNGSDLMRDKVCIGSNTQDVNLINKVLNSQNILEGFPDLEEAKSFIIQEKPDLVIVCLGGASGKQEFFIDNLKRDPEVSFGLATGVGAALDHLGSGVQQVVAPKWMIATGLEWLHRFITQPYRRKRIWDSIFTLWWWTVVQEFMKTKIMRKTVVNIIRRKIETTKLSSKVQFEYLLLRRKEFVAGDIGWVFLQGGVEQGESILDAGIREIQEEVGFKKQDLNLVRQITDPILENYSTSFVRFFVQGAKYEGGENHIYIWDYTGKNEPIVNWENAEAKWFTKKEVLKYLSVEKNVVW